MRTRWRFGVERRAHRRMRDYAKVGPQFWIGPTGRQIKAAGTNATVVAMYLITSPHSNMLGLYYLPTLYLAHETGLGMDAATDGLEKCIRASFCSYDPATEMVWVHEMAAYQIAADLKESDRRCAGVQNDYDSLPENPFLGLFFERYANAFHMTLKRGFEDKNSPTEGASKPHASQEQEQEQAQEQNQSSSFHSDAPVGADQPPKPNGGASPERPKDEIYRRAKSRLGPKCGGLVTNLIAAHGGDIGAALQHMREFDAEAKDDDHFRGMLASVMAARKRDDALTPQDRGEVW